MAGGSERPTLKTIAYMTGLAVTTVSRALKDAPDIGSATKERVRLVARQIGYEPNRAGVRLRTGKTNVISLIFSLEEEIMGLTGNLVHGITDILAGTSYNLTITPYRFNEDPMAPVRYVLETGSADGIIISRMEPDDPRVRYLMEHGFPFATHGRTDMGLVHPFHDFDNGVFADKAVRKLASVGRKRLALFEPPRNLSYARHMRDGFDEAVRAEGLESVPFGNVNVDSPLEAVRQAAFDLMKRPDRPDGIVAGSSGGAMAIVAGLEEAGSRLGEDIDLVSKQMVQVLKWFRPQIMIANEDTKLAGRELARAVLGRIHGEDPADLQSLSFPEAIY